MKTVSINIYKFSELSEVAQNKAVEKLWNINVDFNWYNLIYDFAKEIGLEISGFNLEGNFIKGSIDNNPLGVIKKIKEIHGDIADTMALALEYEGFLTKVIWDNEGIENEDFDLLTEEFERKLLSIYFNMLRDSYEELTTREAIIDTITSNDYDFLASGELTSLG